MSIIVNKTRLFLLAISVFTALSASVAAEEFDWVALSSDVSINRNSIAINASGDTKVWVQRNYDKQIVLGIDTQTGQKLYPHRSVQIQYVVSCAQNKLNMVSWKMFSDVDSKGSLVWADKVSEVSAAYRYSPTSDEEKSVVDTICRSAAAGRRV